MMQNNEQNIELFHTTTIQSALKILVSQKIKTCLRSDESDLKKYNLQNEKCIWLTKNEWFVNGNLFGSVQFSFDLKELCKNCQMYLLNKNENKNALVLLKPQNRVLSLNDGKEINCQELIEIIKNTTKVNFIYLNDIATNLIENINFVSFLQNKNIAKNVSKYDFDPIYASILFLQSILIKEIKLNNKMISKRSEYLGNGIDALFYRVTKGISFSGNLKHNDKLAKTIIYSSIINSFFKVEEARNLMSFFCTEKEAQSAYFEFWSERFGFDVKKTFNLPFE